MHRRLAVWGLSSMRFYYDNINQDADMMQGPPPTTAMLCEHLWTFEGKPPQRDHQSLSKDDNSGAASLEGRKGYRCTQEHT